MRVPEEDAYVMSDETRKAVEENVFGIYDGTKYNDDPRDAEDGAG